MNVPKEQLDAIIAMIPSITAPTVSPLYKTEWFAVETRDRRGRGARADPAAAQARRRRHHRVSAQQGDLRGAVHAARTAAVAPPAALAVLGVCRCSRSSRGARPRYAEKIQKSMVDVEASPSSRKRPGLVSEVQRNLTTINEYQGEINGKLDSATSTRSSPSSAPPARTTDHHRGRRAEADRRRTGIVAGQAVPQRSTATDHGSSGHSASGRGSRPRGLARSASFFGPRAARGT